MTPHLLKTFRLIAILEGISYLLLGITMPLKYMHAMPEPNFYVGMVHGLLFIVYCFVGLGAAIYYRWSFGFSVMVFLASLFPFGTFYLEAKYLKKKSLELTV